MPKIHSNLNNLLQGFPPVIDNATHTLILGSFPGVASLTAREYYAFSQNKFWELIGAVIDVDLRALPYDARLTALLAHGIGLWDVIAEAERKGSLDVAIRNESYNALAALVQTLPALKTIAFNGGTATRIGRRQLRSAPQQIELIDLPSSSPAHTMKLELKRQRWLVLQASLA